MNQKKQGEFEKSFHPYIFILKEGDKIQKNLLDYSLMMLSVHAHETIRSPKILESMELGQHNSNN